MQRAPDQSSSWVTDEHKSYFTTSEDFLLLAALVWRKNLPLPHFTPPREYCGIHQRLLVPEVQNEHVSADVSRRRFMDEGGRG